MYTTVLLCTLVKKEQAIVKPIKRPKNTAKFYLKFRGQYKNTWAIKKVKKSLVNTPNWLKEIAWNLLLHRYVSRIWSKKTAHVFYSK